MVRYTKPQGIYISYTGLLLVVSIIIFLGIIYIDYRNMIYRLDTRVTRVTRDMRDTPQNIQVGVVNPSGDDRYTRAPKPERDWIATPDLSALRASGTNLPSIPTRGIPETYQQMGILKTDDGNTLPLYGRRTSRSDRFQYYSRTDTYNPIQLPVRYNNYDCVDDIGCNELFNGDVISLIPTGQRASVTLYRLSGPTYIPVA